MDLYIALKDFVNLDDKRVKFAKGDVIEFLDEEKLQAALDKKLVAKVNIKTFAAKEVKKETKAATTKKKAVEEVKEDIKDSTETVK